MKKQNYDKVCGNCANCASEGFGACYCSIDINGSMYVNRRNKCKFTPSKWRPGNTPLSDERASDKEKLPDKHTYYIYGYDKDADVYETIAFMPLYDHALEVGKALIYYHMKRADICRSKTGEPFDWFAMFDDGGNLIKTFTMDYPEGIDPELLK